MGLGVGRRLTTGTSRIHATAGTTTTRSTTHTRTPRVSGQRGGHVYCDQRGRELLNTVAVLESPLALVSPAPAPSAHDDRVLDRDWRRPARAHFSSGAASIRGSSAVSVWRCSRFSRRCGRCRARSRASAPSCAISRLIAPTLALFINYPHFVASYRLAYWRRDAGDPASPRARCSFRASLLVAMLLAFLTFDRAGRRGRHAIESFGSRLAGWLVAFMFLTVGWHYVKQAYGCSRVGARLRGSPDSGGSGTHPSVLDVSLVGRGVGPR